MKFFLKPSVKNNLLPNFLLGATAIVIGIAVSSLNLGKELQLLALLLLFTAGVIVAFIFPHDVTILTLLFLAFADPLASYFGIKYGKDKIFGHKSVQGSLAAFIICAGLLFVGVINLPIGYYTLLRIVVTVGSTIELVNEINNISNEISDELLLKLRKIASNGIVPALLQADTSIGRTLEHLLGIQMNSSRNPDYKGIELKSARENKGTRKGLFAQIPNWGLSKFKNRNQLLDEFGYWENGIFRLYNTIRATGRNAQGLILRTDYELNYLFENSEKANIGDFLTWKLEDLKSTLITKHKETFWIEAESKMISQNEHFLYKKVVHTKNPLANQFGLLVDIGAITVDYNMKRLANGKVEDKGCNFKLKPSAMNLLFPPSQTYSLITE